MILLNKQLIKIGKILYLPLNIYYFLFRLIKKFKLLL